MDNRRRRGVPKNLFDLHARYYFMGGEGTEGSTDGQDDADHGAAVAEAEADAAIGEANAADAAAEAALADVIANIDPMGYQPNLQAVYDNPVSPGLESHLDDPKGHYTYKGSYNTPFGIVHNSYMNAKGFDAMDKEDEQSGLTSIGGDTPQDYLLGEETETEEVIDDGSSSLLGGRSRRTFLPSGFWSTRPNSGLDAKRMSQEDQLLYAASPDERYQYLLSRSSEGIMPPKGYNTPSGQYIDLTLVYPDVYAPKMAEGGMIEESSMVEYDPVQIEERANMILEEAYD